MVTKYSVEMGLIAVADSDLQIRGGGGGHPDPEIRGAVLKIFVLTFRVSVWSKTNGEARAPSLDPALTCQPNLKIVSRSYPFS